VDGNGLQSPPFTDGFAHGSHSAAHHDHRRSSVRRLEYELVNESLARVEETERALPISTDDPVQIVAILEGKTPAPWPRRTAARDRKRAAHAMRVLLSPACTRTAPSVEAALGRKVRRKNTENAQHAREARRSDVVKRERDVRLEALRHRGSDRAIAAAVPRKLNLNLDTVRSILRRKR